MSSIRNGILSFVLLLPGLGACNMAAVSPAGGGGNAANDAATKNPDSDAPGALRAKVPAKLTVIGGLEIVLDGSASVGAKTYEWTQKLGRTLAIQNSTQSQARVLLPQDLAAGSELQFNLRVSDGSKTDDEIFVVDIRALETAVAFDNVNGRLMTDEGLAFSSLGMWVCNQPANGFDPNSPPGWVELLNAAGAVQKKVNIAGVPDGINLRGDGKIVVANISKNRLELVDPAIGNVSVLSDKTTSGQALNGANYPLVDKNNNVFVSDNNTTVYRFDAGKNQSVVFKAGLDHPNGMSFGPETNAIYVGLHNQVARVFINADGSFARAETYLTLSDDCGVDGVTFDEAANIYVGCTRDAGDMLYVAPYRATSATSVSRKLQSNNQFRFVNVRFGHGLFSADTLYWTNLQHMSVGKVQIGLKELKKPLAPVEP